MTQIEEAVKAERRAYFKAWRAANKDRVKLHNKTYWEKRVKKKLAEQALGTGGESSETNADAQRSGGSL